MIVLFATENNVNPQSGGIARVTYTLASCLATHGIKCISACMHQKNTICTKDKIFIKEILLKTENHIQQWGSIIKRENVDIILVQGGYTLMNQELLYIRKALDSQTKKVPLFLVFHSKPGYELYFLDWAVLLSKVFSRSWKEYSKQFLIQGLMHVDESCLKKRLYRKYIPSFRAADKIIVLSPSYIDDYNQLVQGTDTTKYVSIPNMMTYPQSECDLQSKEPEVLIVARMDERSKRIKLALRIWSEIPQELLDQGWKLSIVGDGEDLNYYKRYARMKNIKNVFFEGQREPISYYKRASIFMMTSAYEGWPMTIIEAMQHGCVPIAFDSFKAIYDIINYNNGVIVSNNDVNMYISKLTKLMADDSMRLELSQNAYNGCQRFSQEKITKKWLNLFSSYYPNLQ